jgi:hypothetical protein
MISLLTLATLAASFGGPQAGASVPAMTIGKAIQEDFVSFRKGIVSSLPEAADFSAEGVENLSELIDVSSGRSYCLVDFSSSCGYTILGADFDMLGFASFGNFDYSAVSSGFSSTFVSFGNGYHPFSSHRAFLRNAPVMKTKIAYSGIDSLTSYVTGKYGNGFSSKTIQCVSGWSYNKDSDFSVYLERKNNCASLFDEDNCYLASIYKSLLWAKGTYSSKGYSVFPASEASVGPSDFFYSSLMAEKTAQGESRYILQHTQVPEMYYDIRFYFIYNSAYRTGPAQISIGPSCIAGLNARYNTKMTSNLSTDFSFESEIVDACDKGLARGYVWTPTGGDYLNHSMNVVGYALFQKTSGWWIFQHTDKVYLALVDDGYQGKMSAVDFTELEKAGQKGSLFRINF